MGFLDMRTVMFGYLFSNIICTVVIVSLWSQSRKRFPGLSFWVADFCCQTAAVLLIILRGRIPDWASMTLANTLVVAGTVVLYIALERFVGKPSAQIHNYLWLAAFPLAHGYFVYAQPNLEARNILLSVGLLIICGQIAWLMSRRVEPGMRAMTRGVGLVFAGYAAVSIIRIIVAPLVPHPDNDFFRSGAFETLLIMAYQMLFILLTYGLALMVNQRLLAEIQTQEAKFAAAFRSSPYAVTLTRLSDGRILEVNDGFTRITGLSYAEVVGKTTIELGLWERDEDRAAMVSELSKGGSVREVETHFRIKSGEIITGLFSSEIISINGQPWVLSNIDDITARKRTEQERARLEGELAQSRRLESVGLLAGGTAHHLNNLLTPILGYAELVRDELPIGDPRRADLQQVIRAGGRARDIIRQLLAFARRQMLDMKPLDLNALIAGARDKLQAALRDDIALQLQLGEGLGAIRGDAVEIEEALLNLAENARDAMPRGGTLRIETAAVTLPEGRTIGNEPAKAGCYALLTLSDTGAGMTPEVMAHLFEPFYTTKGVGKGTGLGLAMVYGVVKQHGGYIEAQSAAGQGSVFRLYWPQA
jgi:PAS domain S-box-containing protein